MGLFWMGLASTEDTQYKSYAKLKKHKGKTKRRFTNNEPKRKAGKK